MKPAHVYNVVKTKSGYVVEQMIDGFLRVVDPAWRTAKRLTDDSLLFIERKTNKIISKEEYEDKIKEE